MKFIALQDFWSEEMKSQYVKGMSYTVRPSDAPECNAQTKESKHLKAQRQKLGQLVKDWRAQGKIALAESDLPEASVAGAGKVGG